MYGGIELPKLILKKMILKNYMGARDVSVDFFGKTEIRGKNRCGKSALLNAYFDVMTGRLANGSAPNSICPVDSDGNEIPVDEIGRTLVLSIDGVEHEISKITKRKYRKGVLIGTETKYVLDGDSVKSAEVTEFLSKIAPAETVAMCSNASVFLSALRKSTADARKAMESLSGFDLEVFCNGNGEYKEAYEMTAGKKVEDVLKSLKKRLSAENAELDRLNIELDYERRRLDASDKADMEKLQSEKSALSDQIDFWEQSRENVDECVAKHKSMTEKIDNIKEQMSAIRKEQAEKMLKPLDRAKKQIDDFEEKIRCHEENIRRVDVEFFLKKKELEGLRETYERDQGSVFDNSDTCPTCGRKYEQETLEAARKKFEKEKEERLGNLKEKINSAEEYLNGYKMKMDSEMACIEKNREAIPAAKDAYESALRARESILSGMEFEKTPEYIRFEAVLKKAQDEAAEISDAVAHYPKYIKRITDLKSALAEKEAEIKAIIRDAESAEKRIEELKMAVKDQAQRAADVERKMAMLQDFSMAKNAALEEMVNRKFEFIKIRMSEETLSGDVKETLRVLVNGVDYFNGLNHGDRILAEIFLLKGLQDMNGIKLPIWIDDTESLDENRIPDVSRQLIVIRRTDDETLKVCNGEE